VVDDNERWRRFFSTTVQKRPELQVIGEASDGLEAVQKAQQLQPELILLDIGLPTINGIEAARRIREISPTCKILFVSENRSFDIVEKALSTGAGGYVVKSDAGSELLTAITAVLQGKQFVSVSFADRFLLPENRIDKEVSLVPPALKIEKRHGRHEATIYSDDGGLLDGFSQFIANALKAGCAAIVVASDSHREALLPRLHAYGLSVVSAIDEGRYISLDVQDVISQFMVEGMPDASQFFRVAGDLINGVAIGAMSERVQVAAECAPRLWAQGMLEAAIRLEELCNQLLTRYAVDIMCGYTLRGFHEEQGRQTFERICAEHSALHSG